MIKIQTDINKKRLIITFPEELDIRDAEESVNYLVNEANKLGFGLDVITDFSKLKNVDNRSKKLLRSAMSYLVRRKVKRVIRVVGGAKAMLLKVIDFTQGFKGYKVEYVPTLEDAEKKLDSEL